MPDAHGLPAVYHARDSVSLIGIRDSEYAIRTGTVHYKLGALDRGA